MYFLGLIFEADQHIGSVPITIDMENLVRFGNGSLSEALVESITLYQTKSSDKKYLNGRPDIEIVTFPYDLSMDLGTTSREFIGVSKDFYDNFYKHHEGKHVFSAVPVHLQPKSTGCVELRSSNINDAPIIHYPFLSHKEDVTAFLEAINKTIAISKEEPLAKYGVRPVSTVVPLCKNFPFHSDKYWECALRSVPFSLYHPVGTCRMGPKKDHRAVVDQQGRVHGIQNLRVADSSIFPYATSTHTQLPTYMVGEKIALDIKKKYFIQSVL